MTAPTPSNNASAIGGVAAEPHISPCTDCRSKILHSERRNSAAVQSSAANGSSSRLSQSSICLLLFPFSHNPNPSKIIMKSPSSVIVSVTLVIAAILGALGLYATKTKSLTNVTGSSSTLRRQLQSLTNKGNNGSPSSVFPLGECQGDCDNDNECAGSLVCFQRSGTGKKPHTRGSFVSPGEISDCEGRECDNESSIDCRGCHSPIRHSLTPHALVSL